MPAVELQGALTRDEMILDLDNNDSDAYWANWEHAACTNTQIVDGVIEN